MYGLLGNKTRLFARHPAAGFLAGGALGWAAMSGNVWAIIASCFLSAAHAEAKRRQRIADALVEAEADKTPDADGKYHFKADEIRIILANVDRRQLHLPWLVVGAISVAVILLVGKL